MSWLKRDMQLLSNTMEEEFYEALSLSQQPEASSAEHGERLTAAEEGSGAHGLALHRAAFEGNVDELRRLLPRLTFRQKLQLDGQGNTALHVAVLARQYASIAALLDGGLPPDVKSARMWSPVDEAVALRDTHSACMLWGRLRAEAKRAKRAKKEALVQVMQRDLPDFTMQLRWELGSPLFGLLLRHYAPDDTYTMWKVGKRLRVDGTLMGLDDKRKTLIPRWKRGHFSLLVDGGVSPSASYLVDHTTQTYYDLYRERKAHLRSVEEEVADMIREGAGKVRMADAEWDFKPVKTWLGRQAKEKVEGWEAEVYEAKGSCMAATWIKAPALLPPGASFDDYLAMQLPPDQVEEVPLDPMSPPERPKAPKQPPAQQQQAQQQVQAPPSPRTPSAAPALAPDSPRSAENPRRAAAAAALERAASSDSYVSASSASNASGNASGDGGQGGASQGDASVQSFSTFASASAGAGSSSEARQNSQQQLQEEHAAEASGGHQQKGSKKQKKQKARVFSSRCWLARGFPLSLAHTIPLLEVMAAGNQHFAQAAAYLRQFKSEEYFPVKVQVPLMWTVYIMLTFRKFAVVGAGHPALAPGFFDLPVSYKLDRLEEGGDLVAGSAAPLLVRLDSGEAAAVAAAAAAEAQAQAARASGSGGGTPLQRRA